MEVLRVDEVRDSTSRTWEWMVKVGSVGASALSVRERCQERSGDAKILLGGRDEMK